MLFFSLQVSVSEKYPHPLLMAMVKIGLKSLVACALVSLILLTIFSDLKPDHVEGFRDAVSGATVSVDCIVVHCNHSKTGLIMTALDRNGAQANIFLQPSVMADPVPAGSLMRLAVTPSDDDATFMFASSAEIISYPGSS
jgi:hypothetical protein